MTKYEQVQRRLEAEVARLDAVAKREVTRYLVKLRKEVMPQLVAGRSPGVLQRIPRGLVESLRDSMVVADMLGRKRSRLEAQKQQVSLGFGDVLDVLARQLELDLDALQAQYETRALRILAEKANEAEDDLRKAISFTITERMGTRDATRYLSGRFDALGITPRNSYAVENIVRTQTSLAYGAGRWKADQDPAVQSILWGYRYYTVGDDRVRSTHGLLDGVTLPKEHVFWRTCWPPNGWSCRCTVVPLFEKRPLKSAPRDFKADPGFGFNPGMVFTGAA